MSNVLPQLDFSTYPTQIVWAIGAFLLLYVAIQYVFIARITRPIQKRREKLLYMLRKAHRLRDAANKKRLQYLEHQDHLEHLQEQKRDQLLNDLQEHIRSENNIFDDNIAKKIQQQKQLTREKLESYYTGNYDAEILSLAAALIKQVTENNPDSDSLKPILKNIHQSQIGELDVLDS